MKLSPGISGGIWNPIDLSKMVEGTHMQSTYELFDSIKVLLEASLTIDGKSNPGLNVVFSEFLELKEMFNDHQERESKLVVPAYNSNEWKKRNASVTRKELLHQIERLKRDHREVRAAMGNIRKSSGDFQPDPKSSPSLKLCYAQFFQLEQELNTHFFLEEESLFPKMIEALKKI